MVAVFCVGCTFGDVFKLKLLFSDVGLFVVLNAVSLTWVSFSVIRLFAIFVDDISSWF